MSNISKMMKGLERRFKVFSVLSPVTMIGEVVMETLIPLMMARIIDQGIYEKNLRYVVISGLIMILMALVSLACGFFGGRFSALASQGFSRNLRRNLFAKVQSFSFGNVDRFSTSSLVTRLTTDVTNVQNTYQMIIRMCIRAPFMLLSGLALSLVINRRLSLIFLIAIPFLVLVLSLLSSRAYPRFQKMLGQYDKLNNTVQENLIAVRVVKSFVREDFEKEKFESSADTLRRMQVRAEKLVIFIMPVMQIVIYMAIIAALWFGGRMVTFGGMKSGELISFLSYIGQVLMSLMMLSMVFIMLVLSRASISRIVEVLDEEAEIKNPLASDDCPQGGLTEVKDATIDFENVSFSYLKDENNLVLENINLHIDSGAVVGIIGGTGSSKSTLVSLIPRLYDCLDGTVKVGGLDVKKYNLHTLRDSVAMVLQKNVLFSGSVKDNLRWGNENASDEEMVEVCKAASCDDFISSLPDGYDSHIEQGGTNLSGGQKQRLCIARALLKNPKILILDDSTSALDTATDAKIRHALKSSLPESTKIIIAQRIASVQEADVIFVMDNGKINGFGSHEELLKNNEIYREVYESQQSEN